MEQPDVYIVAAGGGLQGFCGDDRTFAFCFHIYGIFKSWTDARNCLREQSTRPSATPKSAIPKPLDVPIEEPETRRYIGKRNGVGNFDEPAVFIIQREKLGVVKPMGDLYDFWHGARPKLDGEIEEIRGID